MTPDIKPLPPEERQTFRWTASGTISANNNQMPANKPGRPSARRSNESAARSRAVQ
jgi:hypothetical protein